MRADNTIVSLAKDVSSLYFSIGHKGIEDAFLKLAQFRQDDLISWITSARGKRAISDIDNDLNKVFGILVDILAQVGDNPSKQNIAHFFVSARKPTQSMIPKITSLKSYLDVENALEILQPFRNVILRVADLFSYGEDAASPIPLDSVSKVNRAYVDHLERALDREFEGGGVGKAKGKLRRRDKIARLFSYLLNRFSSDVADAAQRAGEDEAASSIMSRGILAKPSELSKVLPVAEIISPTINQANQTVKYVLRHLEPGQEDMVYNFVKENVLYFTGMMNVDAVRELYEKRQEEQDLSQYMGSDEVPSDTPEMSSMPMTDAQILNPEYLSMVSAILMTLFFKIK